MSRETVVVLTDDLTGSPATETIEYTLDGVSYEIDLSAENAKRFRKNMSEFVDASRRVNGTSRSGQKAAGKRGRPKKADGGSRKKRARSTSAVASTRQGPDPKAVRQWASEQNKEVPQRGRLSADLVSEYLAATGS